MHNNLVNSIMLLLLIWLLYNHTCRWRCWGKINGRFEKTR